MRFLELRIPPVVVMLVLGCAMWFITHLIPSLTTDLPARLAIAIALLIVGIAIVAAGVIAFRRAQTTVDPTDPGKASSMVTAGIYRFTRNPMYLGFLLVLVGWAAYLSNLAAVMGPILFGLYMARFQIIPEERILTTRFGAAYEAYLKSVRRWL